MVAAVAFLWMVISSQYNLLGWVAFITWGGYFLAGISSRTVIREGISFILGILFGAAIIILGTALTPGLGTFAFPLAVALAAFIIVTLELVPWFDMAPVYFFGAAAFFAAGGGVKPSEEVFILVAIPGLLGLALGVLTGYLRGLIFHAEGVKDPLAK